MKPSNAQKARSFRAYFPLVSPFFGAFTMQTIKKEELQAEALSRAVGNHSLANWPTIFAGFMAKGIAESEIKPRENVFTYHAWRALGRQVRRGEHGVKVVTFTPIKGADDKGNPDEKPDAEKPKRRSCRPSSATVFHISQTDPVR
jgi:hypothetical protein